MVNTLQSAAQILHRAAGILNNPAAGGVNIHTILHPSWGGCHSHLQTVFLNWAVEQLWKQNASTALSHACLPADEVFDHSRVANGHECDTVEAATLDSEDVVRS